MLQNQNAFSPFPWKLHDMLHECSNDQRMAVVSWLPHGKAFKVHKVSEFVRNILPRYFNQTKYKSFQRQLNLWGFVRITQRGADSGAYSHKDFLRDKPELCLFLARQRGNKKDLLKPMDSKTKSKKSEVSISEESSIRPVPCILSLEKVSGVPFESQRNEFFVDLEESVSVLDSVYGDDPRSSIFDGAKFFPLNVDRTYPLTKNEQEARASLAFSSNPDTIAARVLTSQSVSLTTAL